MNLTMDLLRAGAQLCTKHGASLIVMYFLRYGHLTPAGNRVVTDVLVGALDL